MKEGERGGYWCRLWKGDRRSFGGGLRAMEADFEAAVVVKSLASMQWTCLMIDVRSFPVIACEMATAVVKTRCSQSCNSPNGPVGSYDTQR